MRKTFYLFIISLLSITMQAQTTMITPPYLQKGDTVAILATARKHIVKSMQPTIDLLESWGLNVVIGKSIGLEENQLAGSDEQRAADLQEQLDNPNIKAIWCARGGYGTVRVVDLIDFTQFKKSPKWLVGFSDVTVLHSHLNTMGYKSIHGIMPISLAKASKEAIESLRLSLFGQPLQYAIDPHPMNRLGKATGEVVGGNLSILYSLLGSPSAIDCKDKILYIEDLDEYLYHIDRMMMNLKRNGCLESLKGIIVGSMTDMKDNDIPWGKNALEIVQDVTKQYNIPMVFNFPAGHIHDNRALILGATATIEVTENCSTVVFE
ncbi:peptidase S66 [Flavobacterium ammoniigenes]|jgi:muramoyltetrapeptide carboxypeptidase|uniref:Peptidase S66 n=1 Tax=Flavobacterium ammoniigenes TaxID=1751095 RepID=A0ABM7V484_9FLAO|nr:peptidase S66 [Flavobacterium ammoniigenes]